MRSVLHINIPSFFAEIERGRRPELIGRPVIVGRRRGNTSGVVVCASVDARGFGVEEGMSVRRAQRACPDAVVVNADFAVYRQVSGEFMDILADYSPLLEPDSLGSAYMDVTASRKLFGGAAGISGQISSRVLEKLGLMAHIGCASNKLLAKIASGVGRPFARVRPGSESRCIARFSVASLAAVTPRIEKRLVELGVATVGQLAMIPEPLLIRQFGPAGTALRRQSLGMDSSPVRSAYPPDIIIIEHTFDKVLEEPAQVEQHLAEMADEARLRLRKRSSLAGEATLKLYADAGGREVCIPAFFRFKRPTDSPASILQPLRRLLESSMRPGMEVSGASVVLSDLAPGESSQLCLIGDGERRNRLDRAVELIRERFGERSVFFASSLVPAGGARALSRIAV